MSADEIGEVEDIANAVVLQNDAVKTRLMAVDAAIAEGAMALFGEKYGDEVRVVSMGETTTAQGGRSIRSNCAAAPMSGAPATSASIRVVAESASAAGVRRIEALAGDAARAYLAEQDRRVQAAAAALKVTPAEICRASKR